MKELCKAYIFYKWNPSDTVSDVIDKCIDETDTIHTEVSFRTDGVVLTKTDCEIFDANKHMADVHGFDRDPFGDDDF